MTTMIGSPITGRVALVEDEYTLVINRGADAGVAPGMIFAVFSEGGRVVTDPESGRELGRLAQEKLRVKVIDVHELFARAETFSGELDGSPEVPIASYLRVSETPLFAAASMFSGMAELARYVGDSIDEQASTATSPPSDVITINVGDAVELVDASPPR
ncbi:hypothetical protein [Mycolicibacterium hodleri]|uniref:hypothetical protein n=1 Tax=Mycolicibacterium hodleri TaxID=49897 RepID=UPI003182D03A